MHGDAQNMKSFQTHQVVKFLKHFTMSTNLFVITRVSIARRHILHKDTYDDKYKDCQD